MELTHEEVERLLAKLPADLPLSPSAGPIFGKERGIWRFKQAVKAAGLPKETAPCDLRHAFATHAVEASGNLGVESLVGHKQVTTTNRYVHSDARAASTALAALQLPLRSRIAAAGVGCAPLGTGRIGGEP